MVLVLTGTASGQAGNANPNSSEWQRLVAIIQYLQTDYPAAIQSQNPQELEEQKGFAASAVEVVQSLGGRAVDFIPQLRSIQRRIEKGADPEGVRRDCAQLIDGLVFAGGLSRSPRHPPDLALGVRLYATDCAACHGEDGRAEVPIAPSMNPKPLSFHDPDRMNQLTPFKAFNALTFGVTGTAMPSSSRRL